MIFFFFFFSIVDLNLFFCLQGMKYLNSTHWSNLTNVSWVFLNSTSSGWVEKALQSNQTHPNPTYAHLLVKYFPFWLTKVIQDSHIIG